MHCMDNDATSSNPIIVALVVVAGLIILGGTAAAPFIYTLF